MIGNFTAPLKHDFCSSALMESKHDFRDTRAYFGGARVPLTEHDPAAGPHDRRDSVRPDRAGCGRLVPVAGLQSPAARVAVVFGGVHGLDLGDAGFVDALMDDARWVFEDVGAFG